MASKIKNEADRLARKAEHDEWVIECRRRWALRQVERQRFREAHMGPPAPNRRLYIRCI